MPETEPLTRKNAALLAVCAGLASAALFMLVLSGNVIGLLAAQLIPLPIWLIALAAGPTAAAISVGTAALLLSALIAAPVGIGFLVGFGLPAQFLAWVALMGRSMPDGGREWLSTGWLTSAWVACGAVVIVIAIIALPGEPSVAEEQIRSAFSRLLETTLGQADMPTEMSGVIEMMAALPAIIVVSWMLVHLVNGVIAQALLVKLGRALRPTPAADSLVLPLDVAAVLAFSAAFAAIGQDPGLAYIGRNLLLVTACAYLLAGFAAVHRWTAAFKHRRWVLGGVYASAVLLQYPLVALTLIGLIDQLAQARQRFAGKDPTGV